MEQLIELAGKSGLTQLIVGIGIFVLAGDKIVYWMIKLRDKKNGNGKETIDRDRALLIQAFVNQTTINGKLADTLETSVELLRKIHSSLHDQKVIYEVDREQTKDFYKSFNEHVKDMSRQHCNYRSPD